MLLPPPKGSGFPHLIKFMKLMDFSAKDAAFWQSRGYVVSQVERKEIKETTAQEPTWLHFGAGNIFRAFTAALQQTLIDKGLDKHGIIACEGFDYEIIDKAYAPYDNRSLLVTLKANGTINKRVIDSVVESLSLSPKRPEDIARLCQIFQTPSLQMVSFTITEKGYAIRRADKSLLPVVESDMEHAKQQAAEGKRLDMPKHLMGVIAYMLYERFCNGEAPIAMVSMDNCSHNGDKLKEAVLAYGNCWLEAGLVPEAFLAYISDPARVSFPWSMIDKITPRPDSNVVRMLQEDGFEDTDIIITEKQTYTAAFVNAEETEYLVIEDAFPNGRPCLEEAGVLFADRQTVDRVEKMKVCTCLNPLHTLLAIFGCLLSYTSIHQEMHDKELVGLVTRLGYQEGMPVVVDPGIIRPMDFLKAVLEQRLPNPFMPDTPQRIATDTSQKLPIRFGETMKAYIKRGEKEKLLTLDAILLTLAGYSRYLLGVDDRLQPFVPSPDPLLAELSAIVEPNRTWLTFADEYPESVPDEVRAVCQKLYTRADVFGLDLYEAGLGEALEKRVWEMLQGSCAVRMTLQRYLQA